MRVSLKHWGIALSFMLLLSACSEEKPVVQDFSIIPPSKVRIEQICQSYMSEDFRSLVGLMHNYKDKCADYQQQIIYMFKQRSAARNLDSLKITHVQPNQIVTKNSDKCVDIYLDVSYNSGKSEEIVLPLIYDEGKWWIR